MARTTDDQRRAAQDIARDVWPGMIGRAVYCRIVALRVAAGDSDRLNAELDGLVEETLAARALGVPDQNGDDRV
jgi:hypothetical protein